MGRSKEDGRRKRVEHTHVSQADRKRNGDVASTHVYICKSILYICTRCKLGIYAPAYIYTWVMGTIVHFVLITTPVIIYLDHIKSADRLPSPV